MKKDAAGPTKEAPAHNFRKTEAIWGNASNRRVIELIADMKARGWAGPPIEAVEIDSVKYIINGHHRVFAAKKVNVAVQYRIISFEELMSYQYASFEEVIIASAQAGFNRIRLF